MPFTFSHPAIVLPLRLLPKKRISVTGFVIGSLTPDFEYFLSLQHTSSYSHTWLGIFWFDLPLAVFITYLFDSVLRREIINNLPQFLYSRFARFGSPRKKIQKGKDLFVICYCLLIGILSHLCWDKLTHKSVKLIDEPELYSAIWDLNSLIGAATIILVIWRLPVTKHLQNNHNIFSFWAATSCITLLFMTICFFAEKKHPAGDLAVATISGFFVALILTVAIRRAKTSFSNA